MYLLFRSVVLLVTINICSPYKTDDNHPFFPIAARLKAEAEKIEHEAQMEIQKNVSY